MLKSKRILVSISFTALLIGSAIFWQNFTVPPLHRNLSEIQRDEVRKIIESDIQAKFQFDQFTNRVYK